MAGISSYKDFEVYKKAYLISLELHRFSLRISSLDQRSLGDQIRRSSKSVCANFAEGFAKQKYSNNEFKRYLIISLGSTNETIVWLDYCKDLGYMNENEYIGFTSSYEEVARMLQGLIRSLAKK